MKRRIALLGLVLCLILPLLVLAEGVQPDHTASLTLRLSENGNGLAGAGFEIFRVAEMNDQARFELLDGYDVGSTDINEVKGAAAWEELARRLAQQAHAPAAAVTDAQGNASFPSLPTGLYLVMGSPVEIGHWAYEFAPFMVSVPDKDGDRWRYDVVAEVKYQRTPLTTDVKVIKLWKDSGRTSERPSQITVGLYRNGVQYQVVKLNAGNNWSYLFRGLESIHEWTVQELPVPTGYTAEYSEQNGALVIINTIKAKQPVSGNIPQTGLLWWPVPLMAVLGMTLVIIGLLLRRKWRIDHEEG